MLRKKIVPIYYETLIFFPPPYLLFRKDDLCVHLLIHLMFVHHYTGVMWMLSENISLW